MEKIIKVDWNDPKELKNLIFKIKKRRQQLLVNLGASPAKFGSSKISYDSFIPVMNDMLKGEEEVGNYYVYFHCDPTKPLNISRDIREMFLALNFKGLKHVPFYVGKGINNRYLDFNRNGYHSKIRSKLLKSGKEITSIKIKENLSEDSALKLESTLIDILGLSALSKNGFLCNLDEGQDKERRRNSYSCDENILRQILKNNNFI